MFESASGMEQFFTRPKQLKKGMRFGTWNVGRLCRVDEIRSVVGELEKHKLDLVGV
jgi:hypothetical protein